jgi:spore maturation protein CgeB
MRLLIIGNRGGTNVGECFERAAIASGIEVRLLSSQDAMQAPAWLRRFNWYCRGHRPTRLASFSNVVLTTCVEWRPDVLLTTGLAPIMSQSLARIRAMGVVALNYLTDDPWNPGHYSPWFMEAVPQYDVVFSPRRTNIDELKAQGCRAVAYLPFAYDTALHFINDADVGHSEATGDVLFVGGADRDRVPYCAALIKAGFKLSLYGDYWDRYRQTRAHFRGYATVQKLRTITPRAPVCLCLVRKSNRDGHVMRSFEGPAMGGCMLMEDTSEHREMFGPDGDAVVYFSSIAEMVERARWLLDHPAQRKHLADSAYRLITHGQNTYADRLKTMLNTSGFNIASVERGNGVTVYAQLKRRCEAIL